MENDKDQGAAVRGEAVADYYWLCTGSRNPVHDPNCVEMKRGLIDRCQWVCAVGKESTIEHPLVKLAGEIFGFKYWKTDEEQRAKFLRFAEEAAKLSALAADAPSEPSELVAMTDVDSMRMPKRDAFIKWAKGRALDVSETKDAWGNRKFVHPHIESIWFGWFHAPSGPTCKVCDDTGDMSLGPTDNFGKCSCRAADALATQPTVAAQQGSIADDSQFIALLSAWRNTGPLRLRQESLQQVFKYIDSRASSAPVAPIAPPVQPTKEMIASGMRWLSNFQHMRKADKENALSEAYFAMLAAAPQQEGSEAGNG